MEVMESHTRILLTIQETKSFRDKQEQIMHHITEKLKASRDQELLQSEPESHPNTEVGSNKTCK